MRFSSIFVGAAMLLSSVGVAHAQSDLDSKVTVALVRHTTTASGDNSNDVKTRLNTKDLLALINAANTTGDAASLVFRREDIDDEDPSAVAFLDSAPVFLADDGTTVVDPANAAFTTTNIDLGATDAGQIIIERADGSALTDTKSFKFTRIEGNTWLFDENGGVAGDGGDLLTLSMIGTETIGVKRKTSGGDDLGLWFGPRNAKIAGGSAFDADGTGAGAAATSEYLTGTIKAGPEKLRPTP